MKFKEVINTVLKHFMSGVSYMIPFVVAGGLITTVGNFSGIKEISEIASTAMSLVVPVATAFIAYSIADKPAIAPAFVGGLMVNNIGAGFLGGMIVGLTAGYLVELLKKIKLPASLAAVKSVLIIPFFGVLIVGCLVTFVIGTPVSMLNTGLTNWLNGMAGTNAVLLAAIIAAMMAFDMGGPVNKVAMTFGVMAYDTGNYAAATIMLTSIAIPPLGMALATFINKKLYSEEEVESGKAAVVMAFSGMTEGAIPFAIGDPIAVIPACVLGTVVTCVITAALNITSTAWLATIMLIPFTTNPILYVVAIVAGSVVTALTANFIKTLKQKKEDPVND